MSSDATSIIAFDFDGTLIDAHSPVRLVNRLVKDRIMPVRTGVKMGTWGARYKMGRELDQSVPRRYIFETFKEFPASDADAIMSNLYHEVLRAHLRPQALQRIREHQTAGADVILVSASFMPILNEAAREIKAAGVIGTRMEVVNGCYTGVTIGDPPEGERKLIQLREYADERYGAGRWSLDWAYGDHFSDEPVLAAAKHAVVVDPDRRLERIARAKGWPIEEWPV
jgi:HAD superfamily hydrolase (TIGR01490 family)